MDIEKLIKVLYINNFCLEGLNHKVHFTSEIYILTIPNYITRLSSI